MIRLTCAALVGCVLTQSVATIRDARPLALTHEQLQILSHMHLVQADDGFGNQLPTIQIRGVNVQIVNGMGDTRDVNGLGNLIVGYQEVDGPVERTGSHNLIVGNDTDYASYACLSAGGGNRMLAPMCAAVGTIESTVAGSGSAVIGGDHNEVQGFFNVVVGGSEHALVPSSGSGNVIVGGQTARIEGRAKGNVIAGGSANLVTEGEYNAVVGGTANELLDSYFVGTLASIGAHAISAESGALVGGNGNTIGSVSGITFDAVVIGGQTNTVAGQDHATVLGGQLNSATGKWSVVTGGLQRTATGAHDWAAGSLFQDN